MTKLPSLGRNFFAIATIAFGVQHFIYGDFVTRAMPAWPAWIPGRPIWPYLVGAALVAAGAALLSLAHARCGALTVAAMILTSAALIHVPAALAHPPMWGTLWTNAGKGLALGGGALIVAATVPGERRRPADAFFVGAGRLVLAAFLIFCGVEHFVFLKYVAPLVPAWMGAAVFWTYFAGVALIAGGAGLLVPATARIAALLTGIMVFLWVLLLHIPRALADLSHPNETTAVFEALAISGIAFLLATDGAQPRTDANPPPSGNQIS